MFGLSEKGFKRKLYSDIKDDLFIRSRDLFGEDINLSERSPLGIFLRVIAWSLSLLWQVIENLYHQSHLPSATGINLDYVCEKADIFRFPALKSSGRVIITGKANKKIYKGFKVSTIDGVVFETIKEYTIDSDGQVVATVRCVSLGDIGNVQANTINKIVNPEMDIKSVINDKRFANGREIETDDELRKRYKLSFRALGKATINAIVSHLLKIPTLKGQKVLENDTMQEINGMKPKSIKVIVLGGTDEEVAQTILDSKAAGIETNGDISCSVADNMGNLHEIKFSRATELPIFAKIEINFTLNASNKEKVKEEIKERFKKYIYKVPMGDKIIVTRLIASLLCSNESVKDIVLTIGKSSDSLAFENIDLRDEEVATTKDSDIQIVEV